ncbi:threonine/serine exporter family protein [Agrilactobacillus yilanensis]|uniref:Threonine/serine exporter family protein n=1 Tax=Agrilactobacillus yilanensis TaxID=2485997 RepID=A0ABW4J3K2_9LACO|nr:threonine/serine exporter family protein [Agrilactobacillus yilanensis]
MCNSATLVRPVDTSKVFSACLLAGKIMVESGSEMYRVEDTMRRIAVNGGIPNPQIWTTTTAIFVGKVQQPNSQLIQINKRTLNLEKVARVNAASRAFGNKLINLAELIDRLHKIDQNAPSFAPWLQFLSAGVVSAALMIPFSGEYDWFDLPMAFIIGALGFIVNFYIDYIINIKFISEFTASLTIGLLAILSVHLGLGHNADNIIIGAVMPLVPGLPLTNALRDLLAGHLLSGTTRGVEALLSAGAIGSGIALVFHFIG